jgi:hypothetical protein
VSRRLIFRFDESDEDGELRVVRRIEKGVRIGISAPADDGKLVALSHDLYEEIHFLIESDPRGRRPGTAVAVNDIAIEPRDRDVAGEE